MTNSILIGKVLYGRLKDIKQLIIVYIIILEQDLKKMLVKFLNNILQVLVKLYHLEQISILKVSKML